LQELAAIQSDQNIRLAAGLPAVRSVTGPKALTKLSHPAAEIDAEIGERVLSADDRRRPVVRERRARPSRAGRTNRCAR
jgi:hypothetical protein